MTHRFLMLPDVAPMPRMRVYFAGQGCVQGWRLLHHAAVVVGGVGLQREVGVLRRRQDLLVVPAESAILQTPPNHLTWQEMGHSNLESSRQEGLKSVWKHRPYKKRLPRNAGHHAALFRRLNNAPHTNCKIPTSPFSSRSYASACISDPLHGPQTHMSKRPLSLVRTPP